MTVVRRTAECFILLGRYPMVRINSDAALYALIERHAQAWQELSDLPDDDSRFSELSHASELLAVRIITTPAHTKKAVAAKRRIYELEGLDDADVINFIAELDEERIAAAR